MSSRIKAELLLESRDIIGEGPVWDARDARILWSDNKPGILHEARSTAEGRWQETRQWNLGRRIGAAIPRAAGGFVVATGTEIMLMDESGAMQPFASLRADPGSFHLNDAKCDSRGRLWAGTLDADINVVGRPIIPGRGALYRIDPDGTVTAMLKGVTVSNGIDWSPDDRVMYYIDSYTRRIDAFDYEPLTGAIRNRRATVAFASGDGAPDGMTVDAEGCLWVAMVGTGEVRRYSPEGDLITCVDVGTPTPTSCAFGGETGDHLFITSARVLLPPAAFTQLTHGFSVEMADAMTDPRAGALYVCRPGVPGKAPTMFAG